MDNIDEIAEVIEDLDNTIAAMALPLKPAHHLEALKETIPRIRRRLLNAYLAVGGSDLWKDNE